MSGVGHSNEKAALRHATTPHWCSQRLSGLGISSYSKAVWSSWLNSIICRFFMASRLTFTQFITVWYVYWCGHSTFLPLLKTCLVTFLLACHSYKITIGSTELSLNFVKQVVQHMREGFLSGRTRLSAYRVSQLRQLKRLINENQDKLCQAMWLDLHKVAIRLYSDIMLLFMLPTYTWMFVAKTRSDDDRTQSGSVRYISCNFQYRKMDGSPACCQGSYQQVQYCLYSGWTLWCNTDHFSMELPTAPYPTASCWCYCSR